MGAEQIIAEKSWPNRKETLVISVKLQPNLSYDVASESVIKPCIKNDNQLVD